MPTLKLQTLWYGENHNKRSYGKIRYVPIYIWEIRRILMVGFRKNFSRCRYTIYLKRVQGRIPNLRSSFGVCGTVISGNERTSLSARVLEAYNHF